MPGRGSLDSISLFQSPQLAEPKCNTREIELIALRSSTVRYCTGRPAARSRSSCHSELVSSSIQATPGPAFNAAVSVTGLEYCNWPVSRPSGEVQLFTGDISRSGRARRPPPAVVVVAATKGDGKDCAAAAAAVCISMRDVRQSMPDHGSGRSSSTLCASSLACAWPLNTACQLWRHRNTGFVVLTARRRRNTSRLRPQEESGRPAEETKTDKDRPTEGRSGPVRRVRSGPVRSGPVRSDPIRSGPVRSFTVSITSSSFERCLPTRPVAGNWFAKPL